MDSDYDQQFIVYKKKLREMRNKRTPPTSNFDSMFACSEDESIELP